MTMFVPCQHAPTGGVVVLDVRSGAAVRFAARRADLWQTGPAAWCVEAEVVDRDGPLFRVRLPSGVECWVKPAEEAA